ncbi:probable G-protein coupled receptor 139 [Narcine bancroftii]|uniref:probable G-protein coupled receptor 139 n=1 Tax=Narcine bancroftii TaxID=1343680 RepID=UPI003831A925
MVMGKTCKLLSASGHIFFKKTSKSCSSMKRVSVSPPLAHGNLFAIYIICCRSCSLSKTTTIYLVALAVSDTLCLIWAGVLNLTKLWLGPNSKWVYTTWWCASIVLEYGTILLSVWIIMAFTIERYVVLFNKRLKFHVAKPKNTWWIILSVAITCYILTTIGFLINKFAKHSVATAIWVSRNFTSDCHKQCGLYQHHFFPTSVWLYTILSGGIPYLLILLFSILIVYRLHHETRVHSEFESAAFIFTRVKSRRSAQIMLTVSFAAIALGLPRFIAECLPSSLNGVNYFDYSMVTSLVPDILFMLQWLNSAINFWLFSSASSAFRRECVAVLIPRSCQKKPPGAVATVPLNTFKTVFQSKYGFRK